MLEIITVFGAHLYGGRSHKSRKMIADLKAGDVDSVVEELSVP